MRHTLCATVFIMGFVLLDLPPPPKLRPAGGYLPRKYLGQIRAAPPQPPGTAMTSIIILPGYTSQGLVAPGSAAAETDQGTLLRQVPWDLTGRGENNSAMPNARLHYSPLRFECQLQSSLSSTPSEVALLHNVGPSFVTMLRQDTYLCHSPASTRFGVPGATMRLSGK